MDLQSRFLAIKTFLERHINLAQSEVLNGYPSPLEEPYASWTRQLEELSHQELIAVECFQETRNLRGSLKVFMRDIARLSELPMFMRVSGALPRQLERGMTLKKRHESLAIKSWLQEKPYKCYVDIGSGKGHLSMVLLHDRPGESICVDMDEALQRSGHQKIERYIPELKGRVRYVCKSFDSEIQERFSDVPLVLGLHCCGDLSVEAMKFHLKNNLDLLSFGCCYHKLGLRDLSAPARKDPLEFSLHALNLATRSNRILSEEDFQRRLKVKTYRYILHMILRDEFDQEFEAIGNAHYTDYDLPFEEYAAKHAPQSAKLNLQALYKNYLKSERLKSYLLSEAFRAPLGRLIELYLLFDRAIWLQERGKKVEIQSFFDPKLSPRNVGIFSRD